MKVISRGRQEGKTFAAIKLASETGSVIVCHNHEEQRRLVNFAKEFGFEIKYPITFYDFAKGLAFGQTIDGYVIDNLDMFLQYLAGRSGRSKVIGVTWTSDNIE